MGFRKNLSWAFQQHLPESNAAAYQHSVIFLIVGFSCYQNKKNIVCVCNLRAIVYQRCKYFSGEREDLL